MTGDEVEADKAYRRVLEINEYGDMAERAREARTRIAQHTFQSATPHVERMDAVMYCLGVLLALLGQCVV